MLQLQWYYSTVWLLKSTSTSIELLTQCLGMYPDSSQMLGRPPRTPASRLLKSYLKTILANPESRKIFYFLVLNLSYMLVQMLYGVWTNSLGLISDGTFIIFLLSTGYKIWLTFAAIHMAFDCMAIGMGLFASVMATWPPNEQFTYGWVENKLHIIEIHH